MANEHTGFNKSVSVHLLNDKILFNLNGTYNWSVIVFKFLWKPIMTKYGDWSNKFKLNTKMIFLSSWWFETDKKWIYIKNKYHDFD